MQFNFDSNTKTFHDYKIPVETTFNSLYALPILTPKQLINKFNNNNNQHRVVLQLIKCKSDKAIALIAHHFFAHPSTEK